MYINLNIQKYLNAKSNSKLLKYDDLFEIKQTMNHYLEDYENTAINLFNRFHVYQLHNEEMIQALIKEIHKLTSKPILEICAGDGFLAKSLTLKGVKCIATDDLSWEISSKQGIEELDYMKAIDKYKPELVILCWEPYEAEYVKQIMDSGKVKHLIVIGESLGGCTGSNSQWDYESCELGDVSKYCIARTDELMHSAYHTRCYLMQPKKLKEE